jgi:hypothetical protein
MELIETYFRPGSMSTSDALDEARRASLAIWHSLILINVRPYSMYSMYRCIRCTDAFDVPMYNLGQCAGMVPFIILLVYLCACTV